MYTPLLTLASLITATHAACEGFYAGIVARAPDGQLKGYDSGCRYLEELPSSPCDAPNACAADGTLKKYFMWGEYE